MLLLAKLFDRHELDGAYSETNMFWKLVRCIQQHWRVVNRLGSILLSDAFRLALVKPTFFDSKYQFLLVLTTVPQTVAVRTDRTEPPRFGSCLGEPRTAQPPHGSVSWRTAPRTARSPATVFRTATVRHGSRPATVHHGSRPATVRHPPRFVC